MSEIKTFDEVWWGVSQVEAWIESHAPEELREIALIAAVRRGTLTAWGQQPGRDRGGNPISEGAGVHAPIPVEVFADPLLTVHDGVVGPAKSLRAWNVDQNRRNVAFYALPNAPMSYVRTWVTTV